MAHENTNGTHGWFVKLSLWIANVYLIIFAAEGVVTTVHAAVHALAGSNALYGVSLALSLPLAIVTLPVLLLLLFVPQLPKFVFMPPVVYYLAASVAASMAASDAAQQSLLLYGSLLQCAVAAVCFAVAKHFYGAWLLKARHVPMKSHLVLRSLVTVFVVFVIAPVVIGTVAIIGFTQWAEAETDHFLDFTAQGLDTSERVYEKDGKQVWLIGMMHVGDESFYRNLYANFPAGALVLAEGVTDRTHQLTQNVSNDKLAKALGLGSQPLLEPTEPSKTGNHAMPQIDKGTEQKTPGESERPAPVKVRPDVVYADADISDFSPSTIQLLKDTIQANNATSFFQYLKHVMETSSKYSQEEVDRFWKDILDKRNQRVLRELDAELPDYNLIIIPWGAMHMPGLQKGLEERGFKLTSSKKLPLVRYDVLLQNLKSMRS